MGLNIRQILRERKGRIRITLFLSNESTYSSAELQAVGQFLYTLMDRNDFQTERLSPMTTTIRRFNFQVNGNDFLSLKRYVVYEGCLFCPPSAMEQRFLFHSTIH